MLVQREHFFKDIISTATQTCLSKLCLQWIVQFLVKENHLKYINDNLNMYINDHLRMYTSDYALI